jgi:hypothetical protein
VAQAVEAALAEPVVRLASALAQLLERVARS